MCFRVHVNMILKHCTRTRARDPDMDAYDACCGAVIYFEQLAECSTNKKAVSSCQFDADFCRASVVNRIEVRSSQHVQRVVRMDDGCTTEKKTSTSQQLTLSHVHERGFFCESPKYVAELVQNINRGFSIGRDSRESRA